MGFDEFFMISAFFTTLKLMALFDNDTKLTAKLYMKIVASRFVRLAPVYYAIFLFGWLIGPHLSSGTCWFTYDRGFNDCDGYWWSVFTMTINIFPVYQIPSEGCYYWGWFIAAEMQIFIFLPFIVYLIVHAKKQLNVYIGLICLCIFGVALNYFIFYWYNLAAGLFAPADLGAFRWFINKPYTKIHAVALGILLACILKSIRKFKDSDNGEGIWATWSTKIWPSILSYCLGLFFIGFVTLFPL